MLADSTSSDHQTSHEFEVENVKRTCDSIKSLSKSVLFEQSAAKSGSIFLMSVFQRIFSISLSMSQRFTLSIL